MSLKITLYEINFCAITADTYLEGPFTVETYFAGQVGRRTREADIQVLLKQLGNLIIYFVRSFSTKCLHTPPTKSISKTFVIILGLIF